ESRRRRAQPAPGHRPHRAAPGEQDDGRSLRQGGGPGPGAALVQHRARRQHVVGVDSVGHLRRRAGRQDRPAHAALRAGLRRGRRRRLRRDAPRPGDRCEVTTRRVAIRAGWIIAFDGGGHRLLRDGVVVVEGAPHYGLRVYMGLGFRSGRWLTRDGRRVVWEWDEEAGRQGLRRAVEFFEKHDGAHGGLVRCAFSPMQVDTYTPELLREAKDRADDAGRPYTVHASQSVVEFNEMLQRHGMSPIAWLDDLGVLGENTILGHAIIVGGSSWTNYPSGDVAIMAEAGCSVAHAPWVFMRRGMLMESFALYRKAGINVALGTDTHPQAVIEAMRWEIGRASCRERGEICGVA